MFEFSNLRVNHHSVALKMKSNAFVTSSRKINVSSKLPFGFLNDYVKTYHDGESEVCSFTA